MYRIAVIGGSDTVIGFKALGRDTFPVNSAEEASAAFKQVFQGDVPYAIVYIEETWAQELQPAIHKFRSDPQLAIILIPGREGSLGLGRPALKDAVASLDACLASGKAFVDDPTAAVAETAIVKINALDALLNEAADWIAKL